MDEKYSKKAVGRRVRELRLSLHMTQKEFAERLHWDVNTYRKIETGVSLLTTDKAQILHEEYQVDVHYMITGERRSTETMLLEVWSTATKQERKVMMERFFAYLQKIL